jgi:hypothetical protein
MTSLKQIEANRRNAMNSTGPRTPEGKARSRCNAVRHGLTAETVIAALEDADDYQAFELSVTSGYEPQTAVERELILRLASVLWRLRRATSIETALFESVFLEIDNGELRHLPSNAKSGLVETDQSEHDDGYAPDIKTAVGDCFSRLAAMPTFPLDRLSRYEYLLWRQARQLVLTLDISRCRSRHYVP